MPLLFADDSGIASRTGLARTVHVARTRQKPVLEADQTWECGRVYMYGSVYRDPASGGLQMWYMSRGHESQGARAGRAPTLRRSGFDLVLYATSRDGLTWDKPPLRLFEYDGSRENNIVFDLHSPSVLRDEFERDPAKRYKMLGSLKGKYYAASSPDGLHWTSDPVEPIIDYNDTITLSQNAATGEYLAYHRWPKPGETAHRRVIWVSRSTDFRNWSRPELALAPDAEDDAWACRPDERTEIYDMAVYPHAAGFVGLPAMFRVMQVRLAAEVAPGQSTIDGTIDVQLVTSRDGRRWQRPSPRTTVIPRGAPGAFDGGTILGVSSTTVDVGDETWAYYTALTTTHGGPLPLKRVSIGRAEWRRHGFVSLDADPVGGRLETKPVRIERGRLLVNADASRGELRIALVERDGAAISGYSWADSAVLTANATAWPARWKGSADLPRDRAVRAVVELKGARIFSLACDGGSPDTVTGN